MKAARTPNNSPAAAARASMAVSSSATGRQDPAHPASYAAWQRRRPDDAGAWLATICLNAARDKWRRHTRRSAIVSDRPVPDLL